MLTSAPTTDVKGEYEAVTDFSWQQRIVWPNLFYNLLVLGLLITTLILSTITLMRVEEDETTCRLRYEGNENDVTEQQLQKFAKREGWSLTHPESPDCNRCPQHNRFPVWMAPVDICKRFNLNSDTHPLCNPVTENLRYSHVKVCATQLQINRAWVDGGCHNTHDGQTTPRLGWDGALFCSTTTCMDLTSHSTYEMTEGESCSCAISYTVVWGVTTCLLPSTEDKTTSVKINNAVTSLGALLGYTERELTIKCKNRKFRGAFMNTGHEDGIFYYDTKDDKLKCLR